MYSSGRLDRRILIQKKVTTSDALGGELVSWETHYICATHIDFKKAYQDADTDRINSKEETIFVIRNVGTKAKSVNAYDYRIIYPVNNGVAVSSSQAYYITGVQEIEGRDAFLRITTEMRNDDVSLEFSNDYSIDFGVNGYLDVGNNFNFGNGSDDSPFSISLWFKVDSMASKGFLSKDQTSKREYHIVAGGAETIRFRIYDNSTASYIDVTTQDPQTALAGSWHNIIVTYDAGGAVEGSQKIYIDAIEIATNFSHVGSYVAMESTTSTFALAAFLLGSLYFDGNQDEQSIWNIALSPSQISEIYNSGSPTDLSLHSQAGNLAGWWRDGDGDTYPTIIDASGNSKDATMINLSAASIETIVP